MSKELPAKLAAAVAVSRAAASWLCASAAAPVLCVGERARVRVGGV